MTGDAAKKIAQAIDAAEDLHEPASTKSSKKPRLLVQPHSPDETVAAIRDILKGSGLFDRGVPVRVALDRMQGGRIAQVVTPELLVLTVHSVCRPYVTKVRADGAVEAIDVRLQQSLARTYLDWRGEWQLLVLNGIALGATTRGRWLDPQHRRIRHDIGGLVRTRSGPY